MDLAWDNSREYVMSTGLDQTTRLHAPWRKHDDSADDEKADQRWHEIARPQVHGYDINCICAVPGTSHRFA